MFFGPGFNFIFAILVLFFIALFCGSSSFEPIISSVEKSYPASEVGLQKGDEILEINHNHIKETIDILDKIKKGVWYTPF